MSERICITPEGVKLQPDRFGRMVGGYLSYDGARFVAASDNFSRGQNIDEVITTSEKITVVHANAKGRALVGPPVADVDDLLEGQGISAVARPARDLGSTDIFLRRTSVVNGTLTYTPADPTTLHVPYTVRKAGTWDALVHSLGPALWLRLGDAASTTFRDETGATSGGVGSTTGLTTGAPGGLVDDSDTAVTFDGAQGKIAVPNLGLKGAFSVGVLFRQTGGGTVGASDYGTLLGGNNGNQRILIHHPDGVVLSQMGGATLTVAGVAPKLAWHLLVFTWDGVQWQHLYVDGLQVAQAATGAVTLMPIWLGAYLATSTNYSFKGEQDEFFIFNRELTALENRQLWVTARDAAITYDRSTEVRVGFRTLLEVLAPASPPDDSAEVPAATPLPLNDVGAGVACGISLKPYRDAGYLRFGPSAPWIERPLPATQAARDAIALNGLPNTPAATSDNWRNHFCAMIGVDPITGARVAQTQPAASSGSPAVWLRVAGEWIYVVDDKQPRRQWDDVDASVSGWAAAYEAAANGVLGGVPAPADAMPHATGDRYAFVYKPPNEWHTLYGFVPSQAQRAANTLELTGAPSSGGFSLEFDYLDNVNQVVQTFSVEPIMPTDSADAIAQKLFNAKNIITGKTLGAIRNSGVTALVTGGPLNSAPVHVEWPLAAPMRPVAMRVTNSSLNAGTVKITHKNADAWNVSRLAGVTAPGLVGNHQPSNGTAAATGIDWMPMIVDWDEYKIAYDIGMAQGWDTPGTDLGHIIAMSIGDCGTGYVYPAVRGDGTQANSTGSKLVEGALMTLRLDAPRTNVMPEFMPIFMTLQRRGMIPIDKTGGGAEIIFRNTSWPGVVRPFPGPPEMAAKFQPSYYQALMYSIPWPYLQIIDPAKVKAGW